MQVEVPDLQDLVFEERCQICNANGETPEWWSGPGGTGKPLREPRYTTCWRCEGKKYLITPVGERLIEFLKNRGLDLAKERK